MHSALANTPIQTVNQPPGIVTMRIDKTTGLPAKADNDNAIFELFREEFAPAQHLNTPTSSPPATDDSSTTDSPIF